MSDVTLGKLVEGNPGRDAIHLAVVPMVAGEDLQPGSHVRIDNEKAVETINDDGIGIVDPFLRDRVTEGQTFWLCLYPNTITSLRHVWEHPSLPPSESQSESANTDKIATSMEWLESYVRKHCPYWVEVVDGEPPESDGGLFRFLKLVKYHRKIFYYGSDCHSLYDVKDAEELFYHLSIVLGRRINADYFEAFTCSC